MSKTRRPDQAPTIDRKAMGNAIINASSLYDSAIVDRLPTARLISLYRRYNPVHTTTTKEG